MPDLLGMSASHAVSLDVALARMRPRGGGLYAGATSWGVAAYAERAARLAKEAGPPETSTGFRYLGGQGWAGPIALVHIGGQGGEADPAARQRPGGDGAAAAAGVASGQPDGSGPGPTYADTQPFERERGGRSWVFAHEGALGPLGAMPSPGCRPLGDSPAEHAFCLLLDALFEAGPPVDGHGERAGAAERAARLAEATTRINAHGTFNDLMSDGVCLYVHAHTRLHLLAAEDARGPLVLVAMHAVSEDEPWSCLVPGTLTVFRDGRMIVQTPTGGPAPAAAWHAQRADHAAVAERRRQAEAEWASLGDGMRFDSG